MSVVVLASYCPAEVSWVAELMRPVDFYDLKGMIETLLAGLHISNYRFTATQHPTFHPGRCALLGYRAALMKVKRPSARWGFLGEVHPLVQQRYDLPYRAYLCELDLELLYAAVPDKLTYEPISRHQELTRDLAVVVDNQCLRRIFKRRYCTAAANSYVPWPLSMFTQANPFQQAKRALHIHLCTNRMIARLPMRRRIRSRRIIIRALGQQYGAVLR